MSSKRAELETMETLMVVVVIVVMILIGMVFFYKYMALGIKQDNTDFQKASFDKYIFTFPQEAEVSCSAYGSKESCLDGYKMIAFAESARKNPGLYNSRFGFKNITLDVVYPVSKARKGCDKSASDDCSVYQMYLNIPDNEEMQASRRAITTPVSVYLPGNGEYVIGVLTITGYGVGL